MRKSSPSRGRWIVAAAILVLPVVLLLSSVRSLDELRLTRAMYLRNRVATIAARLENLAPNQINEQLVDMLAAEEPALVDLRIYESAREEPSNPQLQSLWRGEALYQTGVAEVAGVQSYRAYVPIHLAGDLHMARIDLAMDSADFLVEHTRHHMLLSLLASAALVGFSVYFLWSERRVVEFQRRELELEHLAQLGELSAVLAHEIRNPLGAIKGFVQLGVEKADEVVGGLLAPVLEETARLEKLVNDLLLYGRPRKPEPRITRWSDLKRQIEALADELIGSKQIRWSSEGDLNELETDPDMLLQVLLNLVRNSIEAVAGDPDGKVVLSAGKPATGGVRIVVEDNGPGLPDEIRGRLFEPFTTTKSTGTGLGLSIARKLTTALGGRLHIGPGAQGGLRAELVFQK